MKSDYDIGAEIARARRIAKRCGDDDLAGLGAAARAALTEPEVTWEEVEKWNARIAGFTESESMVDHILAALRHFARAPGGKVPSVEEIEKQMCGIECARVAHAMMQRLGGRAEMMINGQSENAIMQEMREAWRDASLPTLPERVIDICARVAHAMMMKIGGRVEMMIDGMTVEELTTYYTKLFPSWNSIAVTAIAHHAHRLATTPRTVLDADQDAKAAYEAWQRGSGICVQTWDELAEKQRNGWRAVAKGKNA